MFRIWNAVRQPQTKANCFKKFLFDKLKEHDKNFNDINKIHFSEHHYSHAASAFYPSPFKDAIILTLDGVGEWATTSAWIGKNNKIKPLWEISFPHSIGLLYSSFTYYCGFKVNSGEYKLMGLDPYGEPKFVSKIKDFLTNIFSLRIYANSKKPNATIIKRNESEANGLAD